MRKERAAVVVFSSASKEKKKQNSLTFWHEALQKKGAPPSTNSWSTVTPVTSSRQETCVPESCERGERRKEQRETESFFVL